MKAHVLGGDADPGTTPEVSSEEPQLYPRDGAKSHSTEEGGFILDKVSEEAELQGGTSEQLEAPPVHE